MEKIINKRTFRILCGSFAAHFLVACGGGGDGATGGAKLQSQLSQQFPYQLALLVSLLAKPLI